MTATPSTLAEAAAAALTRRRSRVPARPTPDERRARDLAALHASIGRVFEGYGTTGLVVWRPALGVPDDWEPDAMPYALVDGRLWVTCAPGWRLFVGLVTEASPYPEGAGWWRDWRGGLRAAGELADVAAYLMEVAA